MFYVSVNHQEIDRHCPTAIISVCTLEHCSVFTSHVKPLTFYLYFSRPASAIGTTRDTMVSPLGTFRPQLHSIPDILHAITRDRPDSAFLQADQDVFVSYRVASVMAEKVVAQSLTEHCVNLGLVPATQPKVAIISPNGPLLPLTLWASWYIGAIPCLLNAKADPSLWAAMVRRLDPHIVLVVDSHHRRLLDAFHTEQVTTPIIVLESLIPTRFSVPRPREILIACIEYFDSLSGPYESDISPFVATAETSALVVFTSSGVNEITLKAVTYSHAVLIQSGRRTLMAFGGSEYASTPKTHLGWLPLSHAFEFSIAFMCGLIFYAGFSAHSSFQRDRHRHWWLLRVSRPWGVFSTSQCYCWHFGASVIGVGLLQTSRHAMYHPGYPHNSIRQIERSSDSPFEIAQDTLRRWSAHSG